jgi:molecular chaperone DnaJ
MNNLYEILGIKSDATDKEIKLAYRRLALETHPDRNHGDEEAAEKFKQVANAYEVLSDPQRRSNYDRYGTDQPPRQGPSFDDLFGSFFRVNHQQPPGVRHLQMDVQVDFLDAARGCKRTVEFDRNEPCSDCSGTGAKGGTAFAQCKVCDGQGRVIVKQGPFQMVRPCGTCGGAGRTITDPCTACTGRGHSTAHQTLEVTVPAGSFDGMQLCVRGEGEGTGGHRGDLFLVVHVATHPFFSRSDDDLLITLPVSYSRAVLGGSVEVPGLTGTCSVSVPPGVQSGTVLRLKGQGFSDPHYPERRGDYLVRVAVETLAATDEEHRRLIERLEEVERKKNGRVAEFDRIVDQHRGRA